MAKAPPATASNATAPANQTRSVLPPPAEPVPVLGRLLAPPDDGVDPAPDAPPPEVEVPDVDGVRAVAGVLVEAPETDVPDVLVPPAVLVPPVVDVPAVVVPPVVAVWPWVVVPTVENANAASTRPPMRAALPRSMLLFWITRFSFL